VDFTGDGRLDLFVPTWPNTDSGNHDYFFASSAESMGKFSGLRELS
jgi:hypothetical protein